MTSSTSPSTSSSPDANGEGRSKFAGGCKIGATPPSAAPPVATQTPPPAAVPPSQGEVLHVSDRPAADASPATADAPSSESSSTTPDVERNGVATLTAALAAKRSTDAVSSTLQELQAVARDGGRAAAREKLVELGFGKIGERLRLEHALMSSVEPVG